MECGLAPSPGKSRIAPPGCPGSLERSRQVVELARSGVVVPALLQPGPRAPGHCAFACCPRVALGRPSALSTRTLLCGTSSRPWPSERCAPGPGACSLAPWHDSHAPRLPPPPPRPRGPSRFLLSLKPAKSTTSWPARRRQRRPLHGERLLLTKRELVSAGARLPCATGVPVRGPDRGLYGHGAVRVHVPGSTKDVTRWVCGVVAERSRRLPW